ncbi:MAG TPA: hypothetical protein VF828_02335 [Patescibacteria group bacterium]
MANQKIINKLIKPGIAAAAFFLVFLGSKYTARAESSQGFSISPPFQDVTIEKSDPQKSFNIKITNNTSQEQSFSIKVLDFGSLDESGGIAFLGQQKNDIENKYSLVSWLSLEKDAVIVGPGKSESIKITVLNKESLLPGGHYGAVLVTLDEGGKTEREKVAVNQSYASLVYVHKIGGEKNGLILNSVNFVKNILTLPSKFVVRFQNTGNTDLMPRGIVTISDPWGRIISKGIINTESNRILPASFRKYNIKQDKTAAAIWPGNYKIKTEYRFDGKTNFEVDTKNYFYMGRIFVILDIILISTAASIFSYFWIVKKRTKPKSGI